MTRSPICLLAILLAVVLVGCGGGGGGTTRPVTGLLLSYYYLPPSGVLPFTATVGDQVQLLAYGTHASGQPTQMTNQVTWTSSDPGVATVSATGVLAAKGAGKTTLTITYQQVTPASLEIDVEAPGPLPTAGLYPFAVGNVWTYTGTAVTPTSVRPAQATTLTITVARQVIIEGKVWWELHILGTDPQDPLGSMWLRHEGQGLLESVDSATQYWRLKEPLQTGNQWTDPNDPDHTWKILSVEASVTVPAGTYTSCVQAVEHWITDPEATPPNTPYDITTWYAPGVGPVLSRTTWVDPETQQPMADEQKLTRFEPR
jgi:hypothetical protein